MQAELRRLVIARADFRCEYCRLPQAAAPFVTFHIEHIHAQQHITDDSPENLALACPDCNRYKGPNLTTLTSEGKLVLLFHPRQHLWAEHFQMQGPIVGGVSEIGAATVRLLQMNSAERVELRAELIASGELP